MAPYKKIGVVMIPSVIIRNRFAPVSNNAALTKDKLMMPANGKTVLCCDTYAVEVVPVVYSHG